MRAMKRHPLLTAAAPLALLLTACGDDGVETRESLADATADAASPDAQIAPDAAPDAATTTDAATHVATRFIPR